MRMVISSSLMPTIASPRSVDTSASRGGHSACGEIHNGQLAVLVYVFDQVVGYFQFFGLVVQLVLGQGLETADVTHHAAHVGHGLYHVTCARLA